MKKIMMILGGFLAFPVSTQADQPPPSTHCSSTDSVENAIRQTANELNVQISTRVAAKLGMNRVEGGEKFGLASHLGLAPEMRIQSWKANCKNGICNCQYFDGTGHLIWQANVKGALEVNTRKK